MVGMYFNFKKSFLGNSEEWGSRISMALIKLTLIGVLLYVLFFIHLAIIYQVFPISIIIAILTVCLRWSRHCNKHIYKLTYSVFLTIYEIGTFLTPFFQMRTLRQMEIIDFKLHV